MTNPKRVTGIGGIFFKSKDPKKLAQWYADHLGLEVNDWGGAQFYWNDVENAERSYTVWSPFGEDSKYFEPSDKPYMINMRVVDLDQTLTLLRAEGCQVLDRYEDIEQGKFGYVIDPENGLIELWQPAKDDPSL